MKTRGINIELLHLPSYSPNLNIIERFWKFLKQDCLKNVYFDSFHEFTEAIDMKIKEANTKMKDRMKSLLSLNFQVLETQSNKIL
jgi:hypothetical protein